MEPYRILFFQKLFLWLGMLVSAFLITVAFGSFSGNPSRRARDRILGADISFLPQLEDRGIRFSDRGQTEDALQILKNHRFNYIRLRIFNNPSEDSGYSPAMGFCDLEHTKKMALRIHAAGMKFLLDFHYSDTWADPGKQFKPAAWKRLDFDGLCKAIHDFSLMVTSELKKQGTSPDMVQIGNEINHGILWPDGSMKYPDTLAAFLKAGIAGVREADPSIRIMLHIACGGQNQESRSFLDQMISRGLRFDLIGESYYPQWHGTLEQLDSNLRDLAGRYKQDIIVVEYSRHKKEVNDIVFRLPGNKGLGTFIWEPLNTWESIADRSGAIKDSLVDLYSRLADTYRIKGN
jgi:arabinogalactan endo-1,4-beta-galactosidase